MLENDIKLAFLRPSSRLFCGLHISCLMYADDIVLLSKSAKGLQTLLCRLEYFCNKWNLKVNINKTQIIIFKKQAES